MKGRGGWPFIDLLLQVPLARMVPGDIIVFRTAFPDLLIYKSEPQGVRHKDITIVFYHDVVFYHDGQLKTFRVTTEARLTYMVKCSK